MEQLSGQMFGRYRIGDLLGQGNRASVYRATDGLTGMTVALRVLDRAYSSDSAFREHFSWVMLSVARLRHPNLLPLIDHGIQDGYAFLSRPLITTGGTLRGMLGTILPPTQVSQLLRPVAAALDYAHTQGVRHGDLKPGSILLPQADRPLLADLGIAPVTVQSNNVIATAKGQNFGTPEYLAPEQVQGVAIDHRADFYALGVILYEALVGRPPFRAERPTDTPRRVAFAHLGATPPAPRTFNPALSPAVEQVLLQALEKRPERRYPTGTALFDALDTALFRQHSAAPSQSKLAQAEVQAPVEERRPATKPARGWSRTGF